MKRNVLFLLVFAVAGVASAANVPSGLTGLWQFKSSSTELNATVGSDLLALNEGSFFTGPYTEIGTDGTPDLYWDNGIVQTYPSGTSTYINVPDGIAPNGGGSYVNNYTVMIDYRQTTTAPYNSLFQTASSPGANDGDLWITGGTAGSTIGITGNYSSLTFDASQWHRIVWSVDNANSFKIYVDGTLYVNAAGQGVDGRYSLNPNFYLLADDTGEIAWGLIGTVAVWDHTLSDSEVSGMGGWIDSAATPTALTLPVPEPATISLLAVGALALLGRNRKQVQSQKS